MKPIYILAALLYHFSLSVSPVAPLSCFICGQSEPPIDDEGDCAAQFQYECSTESLKVSHNTTILCKTTRHRMRSNAFSVSKECVTLTDHLQAFPGGKSNGCQTDAVGAEGTVSYCVCSTNLCNQKSFHQQLVSSGNGTSLKLGSAIIMTDYNGLETPGPFIPKGKPQQSEAKSFYRPDQPNPVVLDRQSEPSKSALLAIDIDAPSETQEKPQATLASGQAVRNFAVPIQPVTTTGSGTGRSPPGVGGNTQPRVIIPSVLPAATVLTGSHPPSNTPPPLINSGSRQTTGRITLEPPRSAIPQAPLSSNHSGVGLMCQVCGEGDLDESKPECKEMRKMDCTKQYPPGSQLFCLTRDTQLSNGKHAIEKLCLSASAIKEEYGGNATEGCFSTWSGKIKYCLCSTSDCNKDSIAVQMHQSPVVSKDIFTPNHLEIPSNTTSGSNMCFICSESDLNEAKDCSQQFEYDCSQQYSAGTRVFCMTRVTHLSTGLFSIEKRCISDQDHQQQYPGSKVVFDGCGQAWNGYVTYCTCTGDRCNQQPIVQLQSKFGFKPMADNITASSQNLSIPLSGAEPEPDRPKLLGNNVEESKSDRPDKAVANREPIGDSIGSNGIGDVEAAHQKNVQGGKQNSTGNGSNGVATSLQLTLFSLVPVALLLLQ